LAFEKTMSCLWYEQGEQAWQAIPLAPSQMLMGSTLGLDGIAFLEWGKGGGAAVLMVRPPVWVRVNGRPILGGLRVLGHWDEILVNHRRLYFSRETTPTVVSFALAAGERPPTCPICRGPIRAGSQSVQCPGCSRWFHQAEPLEGSPAKPCWTYAPTCRFCSHPTAFTAEAAWRPERGDCDG
jgi:hypothetical protein